MLVRIADDQLDAWQRRNFLRGPLGIASCDHDLAIRVFAMNAPDRGPRILVGGGCHRTGIQNHDLGVIRVRGSFQPPFLELALNSGPIGLRCPATEILNVETRHPLILT